MPLILAMMTMALLTGLGGALVIGTITETAIAGNFRTGTATFYAADGALEFAIAELAATPDWEPILAGKAASTFVDGPRDGVRDVGGVRVDLTAQTAEVIQTAGGDPRFSHLYACGQFADMTGIPVGSLPIYVAVWVAALPPAAPEQPRELRVVARAYGPAHSLRSLLISLVRLSRVEEPLPRPQVMSWYELR
jgi:hypothetical protein